ncbi:uncharacterized protein LOC134845703 [Symsagittifera roscoffensis]|uniref:uncharacterized protein LOC134845703 n=1 Tax=Symsagittifera roscoffensis TaxID=84072 RepID=UPI00307C5D9A
MHYSGTIFYVVCCVLIQPILGLALPQFLSDFQSPYAQDFRSFLVPTGSKRSYDHIPPPSDQDLERYYSDFNKGENPVHEGDLREKFGLTPDFYDLDPRSEYADSNFLKSLTNEQMKVTGGNGAMGAYNKYPSSVVPGHTEKVSPPLSPHSGGAGDKEVMNEIDQQLEAAMDNEGGNNPSGMNPYPTPPNPCPLPYPDEEGEVKPYNVADGCIPKWMDEAELSKWFQDQQVGKSDSEHNQGADKGHVKKSVSPHLPSYLKAEEKRDSIQMKKG